MIDTANNPTIPPLLQSAQASLNGGFDLLNQGAAEIVNATLPSSPEQSNPGVTVTARLANGALGNFALQDPLLHGIFDTIQAQTQIGASAALLYVYQRTRDDLLSLIAPDPSQY